MMAQVLGEKVFQDRTWKLLSAVALALIGGLVSVVGGLVAAVWVDLKSDVAEVKSASAENAASIAAFEARLSVVEATGYTREDVEKFAGLEAKVDGIAIEIRLLREQIGRDPIAWEGGP